MSKFIKFDEKYFSINLKGTKQKIMSRYSKKRTSTNFPYKDISHHKICIITVINKDDNITMNIDRLESGTTKMLDEQLGNRIENVNLITTKNIVVHLYIENEV